MRRFDRIQRSTKPSAVAMAVVKKYSDDLGGSLATLAHRMSPSADRLIRIFGWTLEAQ
jgi:hypothetical protein